MAYDPGCASLGGQSQIKDRRPVATRQPALRGGAAQLKSTLLVSQRLQFLASRPARRSRRRSGAGLISIGLALRAGS